MEIDVYSLPSEFSRVITFMYEMISQNQKYVDTNSLSKKEFLIYKKVLYIDVQPMVFNLIQNSD
jgi:hypothetical protein